MIYLKEVRVKEAPMKIARLNVIGLAALGLLLASLGTVPSRGGRDDSVGPRFISDENVTWAQKVLVSEQLLRSNGFTRGRIDLETRRALVAFQHNHDIVPSGLLDPETMGMLASHAQGVFVARTPAPAKAPIKVAEIVEPLQKFDAAPPQEPTAPAPAVSKPPAKRPMPPTASPIPLLAALGGLLVAGGAMLLRGRRRGRGNGGPHAE